MLAIRLQRVGRKNDPSFRVIVADTKLKPKTGNFLEVIGSYNARVGSPVIDTTRAKYWLSVGAKASGTVHNLLVDLKAVSGKKINVLNRRTLVAKEEPAQAEKGKTPEVAEEAPSPKISETKEEAPEILVPEVAETPEVPAEVSKEEPVA